MADPFPIPYNPDISYFAVTDYRDQNRVFGIKRKDRRQHLYILGKSGTGKSALMANLVYQNIIHGDGVCLIDPHGELAESILEIIPENRVDDVIYFNPADTEYNIGFNVLEVPDPKYKHLIASGLMGVFTKIWANAWSSRMEYILNNAILALLDTPGSTLLGIPRLLVDKGFRQDILQNVSDPVVKAFWINEYEAWQDKFRNEAIQPVQNKVGQFLSTPIIRNIVGQARSTINIFDIMNQGKILIVNVSKGRVGEDNSALLGAMIVTKIQLAAMERVRIPEEERRDFYLYVDEFQNFVNESFASILSEARKYRLNLTVAHQYVAQLETSESTTVRDAVFGNVGTMIIFRVGATDAEFLEKEFQPEFVAEDFVNLPNYHAYLKLLVDGMSTRPFSSKTIPPIFTRQPIEMIQKIIDTSRALYTKARPQVEEDITKWASGRSASGNQTSGNFTEGNGDYEGICAVCGKRVKVPFEPKPGLPIYCKEDLAKVKSGEIPPAKAAPPRQSVEVENAVDKKRGSDSLSLLGIEFKSTASSEAAAPAASRLPNAQSRDGFRQDANRNIANSQAAVRRVPVRQTPEDPGALAQTPLPADTTDPAAPVSFDYKDILSAAGVRDGTNLEEVPSEQKPEEYKKDLPVQARSRASNSEPLQNKIQISTSESPKIPDRFASLKLPNSKVADEIKTSDAESDTYVPKSKITQSPKIVRDAKEDTRAKLRSALSAIGIVDQSVEGKDAPTQNTDAALSHKLENTPAQVVSEVAPISDPELERMRSELASAQERERDMKEKIAGMENSMREFNQTITTISNRQSELEASRRLLEDQKAQMDQSLESERTAFLERIRTLESDNQKLFADIDEKSKALEAEKMHMMQNAQNETKARITLQEQVALLEKKASDLEEAERMRKYNEEQERKRHEVPEDVLQKILS